VEAGCDMTRVLKKEEDQCNVFEIKAGIRPGLF
jgi:hypothetical protein